jgi:hypothetical protein
MWPEQLRWLCNYPHRKIIPTATVKFDLLDVNTVSDSTHVMRGDEGENRNIERELRQKCSHAKVTAIAGGTAADIIKGIVAREMELEKQDTQGESSREALGADHKGPFQSVAAGSILHCTWNLNECFEVDQHLIGEKYEDWLRAGVKMIMEGVAIGESAKANFPRAIFDVGGTEQVRTERRTSSSTFMPLARALG